jgi:serine/threonine protein kinase
MLPGLSAEPPRGRVYSGVFSMSVRRKFRFIRELARGGFGTVYLAEMITGDDFSTVVAVKVLHQQWAQHQEVVMRSRDEARLLGRLRHRHIVRVEDLTNLGGHCAVVMEYLEGVDMGTLIPWLLQKGEHVPPRMAFQVVGAVAAALEVAFNHVPLQGGKPLHLIHRDIKPSNVMVTVEGEVKLLDFGTARANFETREAHTEALHFGSQIYMAPERFMGDRDTRACDVFALGITLFELLVGEPTGRVQLREERYETALKKNLERVLLPGVDEKVQTEVRRVLGMMMSFEEVDRMTAMEVEEAMEALAEEVGGQSLRRFCRESLKEVMRDQEPLEAVGDSLAGQTMEEDRTATFDTEGLPIGEDDLGALTPTAGGSETSAGWLTDYDEDLEETAAAAPSGGEELDRTLDLGNVDEQPVWTSETFPRKQPGLQVPEGTTQPAPPPPPIGSENTTASAPSLSGTLGFESGELTQDATTPTQAGSKKAWVIAAGVALVIGGTIFLGGGSEEPALPVEAAPVVVEAPTLPSEPAEEPVSGEAPAPVVEVVGDVPKQAAPVAAPAPSKPSPAPRASSRPGSLKLNTLSVGGAQVKVSQASGFLRICRSPCIRLEIDDLKPGNYTTEVTPKSGGPEETLTVRVRSDKTCRYNLKKITSGLQWEERGCE